MARINFSEATKELIAKRAAYRCCFPNCDATLIGPGMDSDSIENVGECAHIYAASGKGPRGQHNLTNADLAKPENGMFLCKKHHSLIDKHKGKKYPPETLMLYKQMHEHKISQELGHITYPLMWIKQIKILESPILKEGLVYDFTKNTILFGGNGSGKSVIIEYIYSALTGNIVKRMRGQKVVLQITLSNPIWKDVVCTIQDEKINYHVGKDSLTFCPFSIDVIYLRDEKVRPKGDFLNWIGLQMDKDRTFVKRLIEGADLSNGYVVSWASMKLVRSKPYETIDILVKKNTDDDDDKPWVLGQFSGTERSSLVFDLIVGYLRKLSRYRNTLLLIDWPYFNHFDGSSMNYYYRLFHDSSSFFQSITVMHSQWDGVDWTGWNVVKMDRNINLKERFHTKNKRGDGRRKNTKTRN